MFIAPGAEVRHSFFVAFVQLVSVKSLLLVAFRQPVFARVLMVLSAAFSVEQPPRFDATIEQVD
jgi:hypothetical protein